MSEQGIFLNEAVHHNVCVFNKVQGEGYMVPMRYGSRYFFQSVIFAPKTFSFMTNLLGYIPSDNYYISLKKF